MLVALQATAADASSPGRGGHSASHQEGYVVECAHQRGVVLEVEVKADDLALGGQHPDQAAGQARQPLHHSIDPVLRLLRGCALVDGDQLVAIGVESSDLLDVDHEAVLRGAGEGGGRRRSSSGAIIDIAHSVVLSCSSSSGSSRGSGESLAMVERGGGSSEGRLERKGGGGGDRGATGSSTNTRRRSSSTCRT